MKMLVLTRPATNAKVAILPTGGLVVVENKHADTGKSSVKVYSASMSVDVKEPFDTVVTNLDAVLESWNR